MLAPSTAELASVTYIKCGLAGCGALPGLAAPLDGAGCVSCRARSNRWPWRTPTGSVPLLRHRSRYCTGPCGWAAARCCGTPTRRMGLACSITSPYTALYELTTYSAPTGAAGGARRFADAPPHARVVALRARLPGRSRCRVRWGPPGSCASTPGRAVRAGRCAATCAIRMPRDMLTAVACETPVEL